MSSTRKCLYCEEFGHNIVNCTSSNIEQLHNSMKANFELLTGSDNEYDSVRDFDFIQHLQGNYFENDVKVVLCKYANSQNVGSLTFLDACIALLNYFSEKRDYERFMDAIGIGSEPDEVPYFAQDLETLETANIAEEEPPVTWYIDRSPQESLVSEFVPNHRQNQHTGNIEIRSTETVRYTVERIDSTQNVSDQASTEDYDDFLMNISEQMRYDLEEPLTPIPHWDGPLPPQYPYRYSYEQRDMRNRNPINRHREIFKRFNIELTRSQMEEMKEEMKEEKEEMKEEKEEMKEEKEPDECSICYEILKCEDKAKLNCSHEFCAPCIKYTLQNHRHKHDPTCALCREKIRSIDVKTEEMFGLLKEHCY